ASLVLQKMTPEDDVEAYLLAFERCVEQESWPREQWAGIVAPFLLGEAQRAYFDLEPEAAADYFLLKVEILARAGVTPMVWAQRFHTRAYQADKVPRSQMFDLIHLTRRWLQPDINSPARIVELVVMDRYLVGQGNPANAQELIALVERQVTAEELVKTTTTAVTQQNPGPEEGPKLWFGKLLRCYRCNEPGHIAIQCPLNDEPMQCDLGDYTSYQRNVESTHPFLKHIDALIDSGSAMTLVSATLIKPSQLNHAQKRGIACVPGDISYYPTTLVKMEVQGNTNEVKVGVVPKLPYLAIIGHG
uniref:CCHC-type domain-containing protein n=1 Tax=Latimeria chalumnae TaxID=7897 RepID=H3AB82_LATCH